MFGPSEIFISRAGQRYGPYRLQDIKPWVAAGQFFATDLAFGAGTSDWIPLPDLIGMAEEKPSYSLRADRIRQGLHLSEFGWTVLLCPYAAAFVDPRGVQQMLVPAENAVVSIEEVPALGGSRIKVKRGADTEVFSVAPGHEGKITLWRYSIMGPAELGRALSSGDRAVREKAIRAAAFHRDPQVVSALLALWGRETDPFLRCFAALVLDALGQGPRVWSVLREAESLLSERVLAAGYFSCRVQAVTGVGRSITSAGLSMAGAVVAGMAGPFGLVTGHNLAGGLYAERKSNQWLAAAGLQNHLALAVTTSCVHAFAFAGDGKRVRLADRLTSWPRSEMKATVTDVAETGVVRAMQLILPGHDRPLELIALDDDDSPGAFDKVIRLLSVEKPSSPADPFSYQLSYAELIIPAFRRPLAPLPTLVPAEEAGPPPSSLVPPVLGSPAPPPLADLPPLIARPSAPLPPPLPATPPPAPPPPLPPAGESPAPPPPPEPLPPVLPPPMPPPLPPPSPAS